MVNGTRIKKQHYGFAINLSLLFMMIGLAGLASAQVNTALEDAQLGTVLARPNARSPYLPLSVGNTQVAVIAQHTDAELTVTQSYTNTTPASLEAVYLFVLPEQATRTALRVNGQSVKTELRTNGLLRTSLGKLAAGETVDIDLSFTQALLQDEKGVFMQIPLAAKMPVSLSVQLDTGLLEYLESRYHDVQVLQREGLYEISLQAERNREPQFELRWSPVTTPLSKASMVDATLNSLFSYAAVLLSGILLTAERRHRRATA